MWIGIKKKINIYILKSKMVQTRVLREYIRKFPDSKMSKKYKNDKNYFLYFSTNELDELVINSTKTKILEWFESKENLNDYEEEFLDNYKKLL